MDLMRLNINLILLDGLIRVIFTARIFFVKKKNIEIF